jgi:two-component system copper resistance phosphate regulon response regulator CusR
MRILLVEEDSKISALIARGLKAERYAVDVCSYGRDCLEMAETFSYDLIILNPTTSGREGEHFLRRIRYKNSSVPILILAASNSIDNKVRLFECGADDYVTKPFLFAELLIRSKALMRRGPVNRSNSLTVNDLKLDRLTHDVRRAGVRIDLTTKEYAVLEYLMINQGRILSRNMIVEHVWDQAFDGVTNIVDVYVRHLRTKVDDRHDPKLIHTVRGSGYTIRCEADA